MTTDQAVNRQADHENLIRELADALAELVMYVDMEDVPSATAERCAAILAKVQS